MRLRKLYNLDLSEIFDENKGKITDDNASQYISDEKLFKIF